MGSVKVSVTEYYSQLVRYWQLIDVYEVETFKNADDQAAHRAFLEKKRVVKFLFGLHRDLEEVCGRVMAMRPLPKLRSTYAEVRRG